MALNTPVSFRQIGNTTTELINKTGVERQLVIDTTKNTVVVMDGTTAGGHPLAKEALKIKSASPNLKINGGAEATLAGDITITMLPGYVPTGFAFVENPAGQPAGKYLEIKYTDTEGAAKSYFVNAAILVDTYTAGTGVTISGDNVISVDPTDVSAAAFAAEKGGLAVSADGKLSVDATNGVIVDATTGKVVANPGDGLKIDAGKITVSLGDGLKIVDGKLTLDLAAMVDATSLLKVNADGKLSNKAVVSTDADNILKAGTDGGVFLPGDLGTL